MAFGAAVGGPGPTSLAYRRAIARLSSWRWSRSNSSGYSTLHSPSQHDPPYTSIRPVAPTSVGNGLRSWRSFSTSRHADSTYFFPDFDPDPESLPTPSSKRVRPPAQASWKRDRPPEVYKAAKSKPAIVRSNNTPRHRPVRSTVIAPSASTPTAPPRVDNFTSPLQITFDFPTTSADGTELEGIQREQKPLDVDEPSTVAFAQAADVSTTANNPPTPAYNQTEAVAPTADPATHSQELPHVPAPTDVQQDSTPTAVPQPTLEPLEILKGPSAQTHRSRDQRESFKFVFPKPIELEAEDGLPYQRPYDKRFGRPPRKSPGPAELQNALHTTNTQYHDPDAPHPHHGRRTKTFSNLALVRMILVHTPRPGEKNWDMSKLDNLVISFWQIYSPDKSQEIEPWVWHRISLAIEFACSTSLGRRKLMDLVIKRGEDYVLLRDMAIEVAAVSDKWEGLFSLAVAFLAEQHPAEVMHIWQQYREKIFAVDGKNQADLESWDRQTRLNARSKRLGIRPINRVFVAAITVRETMTADTLRYMTTNMRGITGNSNGGWTIQPILAALDGYPSSSELKATFETNWKDVILAGTFEHSKAAALAIRSRSLSAPDDLLEVYRWILDKALGTDPLLRTVPWNESMLSLEAERGPAATTFLLPRKIWSALTNGFIVNGQFRFLVKLWTQDLPALKVIPRPSAIGDIILKLQTYMRPQRDATLLVECQKAIAAFGQLHAERRDGSIIGDDPVRAAALQDLPIADLYDYLSQMTLTRGRLCGNRARTELLMQLIFHGRYESAIEVLAWPISHSSLPVDPLADEFFRRDQFEPIYWTSFIRAVGKKFDRDPLAADRLLKEALPLAPPPELRSPMFISAIAAHHILMGRNIDQCLKPVFKHLHDGTKTNSFGNWGRATVIVMTQQTGRSNRVDGRLADASLRIIENFLRVRPSYFTETGAMNLISEYTRHVCTAERVTSMERMTFILRALTMARVAFKTKNREYLWTFAIREVLLRNDGDSQLEAMQLWHDLEKAMPNIQLFVSVLYRDFPSSNEQCRRFIRWVVISRYAKSGKMHGGSFWEDPRTTSILEQSGILKGLKGRQNRQRKFTMKDGAEPQDLLLDGKDGYSIDLDPHLLPDVTDDLVEVYGEMPEDGPRGDTKATKSTDPTVSVAPLLAPVLSGEGPGAVPYSAPLEQ